MMWRIIFGVLGAMIGAGAVAAWPEWIQSAFGYSLAVMRLVLALMAVFALLAGPVAAAASQVVCDQAGQAATATMDMSAMPGMAQAAPDKTSTDPCCDHGASHKMDPKSCAQACADACAVAAAMPGSPVGYLLVFTAIELRPAALTVAYPHEPPGLIRPPKTMA